MPLTKTAKRALRSSKRKESVNKKLIIRLDVALRKAKTLKSESQVRKAISMVDKAKKRGIIHKNKSNHIKSDLSKLLSKKTTKAN